MQGNAYWKYRICGEIIVEVIHDGLSSEFFTVTYTYLSGQANRVIDNLPQTNDQINKDGYDIILRLYFEDYPDVTEDVPINVKVYPCKVTSVNYDYRDHTGIYTYNQYADTVALTIDTRTLELTPQCIYPEIYTLTMTPEIDVDSSQDLFYSMSG